MAASALLSPSRPRTTHLPSHPLRFLVLGFLASALALCLACAPSDDDGSSDEATTVESTPIAEEDDTPPVLESAPGFGYEPRACGFDLDDDGVFGEPEDDCRICDGATTDPDGDGIDENLFYVDCDAGEDAPGCGAPDRPCASLAFAFQNLAGAASPDGPEAENIVCFRGTCRESEPIRPNVAGAEGTVEVAARDGEARAFERAKDPTMLVGWDADGDGEYPPVDVDDTAILEGGFDGGAEGAPTRALHLDARADRFEAAHFTARDHGRRSTEKNSGFLAFGPSQGELEHVFVHDLHLIDVNRGRATASEVSTINLFAGKTLLRHVWIENVWAPRNGGWFARGSGLDQGPDAGPLRFARSTVSADGCDFDDCAQGAAFAGFHLWGRVRGIEIVDNHFDAGTDDWQPKPRGGPTGARFALVAQCSQDWTIRGNLVVDFKNALRIQGWAERYCDDQNARPVTDVIFDGNVVRNDYEPWGSGDMAVEIADGGEDPGETVGDVRITHNVLASPVGGEACVWVVGGNGAETPPGTIVVAHNTCILDVDYHGALTVGTTGGPAPAHPPRIEMTDNLVTGLGRGDPNVRVSYPPETLRLENNRYDPVGGFVWLDEEIADLAAWREASGLDDGFERGSAACLPVFVDFENGDYRLSPDDTCAGEAGARPGESYETP